MVDTLLLIAEVDDRRVPLKREPVDVDAWLRHTAEVWAPAFEEHGVRLSLHTAAGTVETDRALLDRVLSNLLDNALRHGAAGGRVELEAWHGRAGRRDRARRRRPRDPGERTRARLRALRAARSQPARLGGRARPRAGALAGAAARRRSPRPAFAARRRAFRVAPVAHDRRAGAGVRGRLGSLLLLAASLALVCGVAELVLRLAGYVPIYDVYSKPELFWQHDERLGWSLEPGARGRYVGPRPFPIEFDTAIEINSLRTARAGARAAAARRAARAPPRRLRGGGLRGRAARDLRRARSSRSCAAASRSRSR